MTLEKDTRILFLTDSSKYSSGGVRQLIYNLKGLSEAGFRPALICRKDSDIGRLAAEYADIFYADFSSVAKSAFQIASVIRRYNPNIIHSYHSRAHKAAVLAKILAFSKAKLFINRGITRRPGNLFYYKNFVINGFTCNSQECVNILSYHTVPKKKLNLLHNGIDPELFTLKQRPDDTVRVVYIGNGAKPKGFDLFRKAIQSVNTDVSFKAVAIGLNDVYDDGLIRSVGKQKNIQDFLYEGDIFVLSSRRGFESFPNVLLEAMSCGMAPVCFDVGAVGEIMEDGRNGFIVGRENFRDMASKITFLIENPEVREKMGKKNRQDVTRRFSYTLKCQRLLDIYMRDPSART